MGFYQKIFTFIYENYGLNAKKLDNFTIRNIITVTVIPVYATTLTCLKAIRLLKYSWHLVAKYNYMQMVGLVLHLHLPAKQNKLHVFSIPPEIKTRESLFQILLGLHALWLQDFKIVRAIKLNRDIFSTYCTNLIRKLIIITSASGNLQLATSMVTKVDQSVSCIAFPN